MTTIAAVPGIERTSEAFRRKLVNVAHALKIDPSWLAACISFETAKTFDPAKRNPYSGAIGLIQFTDVALVAMAKRGVKTTKGELAAMTAEEQLDYVLAYLAPYKGRMASAQDVYMAIFAPVGIGKPGERILYAAPSLAYEQNKGLDWSKKGAITVSDAAAPVLGILTNARGVVHVTAREPESPEGD